MKPLKVAAETDPNDLAGAISAVLGESGAADVRAIGPKALSQALKAVVISRSHLVANGQDLSVLPSFFADDAAKISGFNLRVTRTQG